jgi:hypothetical protein
VQLDFRIADDPCSGHPAKTPLVYDRAIRVGFTEAGQSFSRTITSVPLHITTPRPAEPATAPAIVGT